MKRHSLLFCIAVVFSMLSGAYHADAQDYPNKPIRLIVPFGPGNSADIIARLVASKLNERLGWTVFVENKPGGRFILGLQSLLQAPADGYTLIAPPSAINVLPSTTKNLPFDILKDFAPITRLISLQLVLAASNSLPANNVRELVEYSKANPGKLSFAAFETGSGTHLAGLLLRKQTGVDAQHVPYKDTTFIADMMNGTVPLTIVSVTTLSSALQAKQIKSLAVLSLKRNPSIADIPTIGEQGFPPMDTDAWIGLMAKAGTPTSIIDRWNKEVREVLELPDVKVRIAAVGALPSGESANEFKERLQAEISSWGKLIKEEKLNFD